MNYEWKREPDPDVYNGEKQAKALRAAARLLLRFGPAAFAAGSFYSGATSIDVADDGVARMLVSAELWRAMAEGREVTTGDSGRDEVTINGVVVTR